MPAEWRLVKFERPTQTPVAPLRRKSAGAYTPEDLRRLNAEKSLTPLCRKRFGSLTANVHNAETVCTLIAPEKLMRTPLLQVFYSVRSERMLMVQMCHDLLFRWFVRLAIDHAEWDHSVFSKDRDRLAKLRLYTNILPLQIATLLGFFTPRLENSSSGNLTGKLSP